jgi:acid phosphatase class B
MDISSIAAQATAMKQTETAMQYSVAMTKKGLDVQKMMGEATLKLIQGADASAAAQGKGGIINVTA